VASETAEFKALVRRFWDDWNRSVNPDDVAQYYSKDPRNLYYDLYPLKFTGWAEFEAFSKKQAAGLLKADMTPNDDFRLIRDGGLAITTFTFHVVFYRKDGSTSQTDGRDTCVWQKQDGRWLIIHQHLSAPVQ
jgi:ketosteroid isomerase-like protein